MGRRGENRRTEFWRLSSRNRAGHQRHPLTMKRRERIAKEWSAGKTEDEIAFLISVDVDTVHKHLRALRKAKDARAVIRHPATRHALEAAELLDEVQVPSAEPCAAE